MKTYLQFQKIIAVLMIFILLIVFTGCYSTRNLTTSDISISDIYLIHLKNSTFPVDSLVVSNEILSGKMIPGIYDNIETTPNHIYLSPDTAIKIEGGILNIPVQSISKIIQKVPEPKKTRNLIIWLAVGAALITTTALLVVAAIEIADAAFVESESGTSHFCSTY